jgi:hypothetical protein
MFGYNPVRKIPESVCLFEFLEFALHVDKG